MGVRHSLVPRFRDLLDAPEGDRKVVVTIPEIGNYQWLVQRHQRVKACVLGELGSCEEPVRERRGGVGDGLQAVGAGVAAEEWEVGQQEEYEQTALHRVVAPCAAANRNQRGCKGHSFVHL